MKELKAIATYLINNRITSSQSMSKWFVPLVRRFALNFSEELISGQFHQYVRELHEDKSISSEICHHLLQISLWLTEATKVVNDMQLKGISIILCTDEMFPKELMEIADKPSILYCYGKLDLLSRRDKVTIVGTRNPSAWGSAKAQQFAFESAKCGVVTISGCAPGIDTEIFEHTSNNGGATIAVLPQLTKMIFEKATGNNLFISEYPLDSTAIQKWQFIARNRLLAALTPVTIVVEAPLRSGTLITAELALAYDKAVYIVLPDPHEEAAYGGQVFGIQQSAGMFVHSMYDIFYNEGINHLLERYKEMISVMSQNKIVIKNTDHRHLAQADLRRYLLASAKGDLSLFESFVVELHRFGIIRERKNKIVFNFSGDKSWPKI